MNQVQRPSDVSAADLTPGQQKALRLTVKAKRVTIDFGFSSNKVSPDLFRGADGIVIGLNLMGLLDGKELWGNNASDFGGCWEYTPNEHGLRVCKEIRDAWLAAKANPTGVKV